MKREMAFWTLVLLAGIVLGLHEWWTAQHRAVPSTSDAMAREDLLLPRGLDAVQRIEIASGGAHRVIERRADGWRYAADRGEPPGDVTAPAQRAESAFIAERLAMFAVARFDRELEVAAAQRARFGIDRARGRVRIMAAESPRPLLTLVLGERTPDGFGQYLLLEPPGRLVVVPAYHVDNLMRLFHGS